jgi:hypothetical protein
MIKVENGLSVNSRYINAELGRAVSMVFWNTGRSEAMCLTPPLEI